MQALALGTRPEMDAGGGLYVRADGSELALAHGTAGSRPTTLYRKQLTS